MSRSTELLVRAWRPTDTDWLAQQVARRAYPDSLFMSGEQRRDKMLVTLEAQRETLHDHPTLRCLVLEEGGQPTSYAVLLAEQTDGVTGDEQTELLDFYAPTPRQFEPLLAAVKEQAGADGSSYLICNLYAEQKREAMWLAKERFVLESRRNVMSVAPGQSVPEHPQYRLRRARQIETLFIMRLVSAHAPRYAPAGRNVDPAEVSSRFLAIYSAMDVRDRKKVPLVLVHRQEDFPVGYIILQPDRVEGGPLTLYLYDVAMAEEMTGAGLGLYLHRGGINLLGQMGGGLFYGDTAATNRLAQSAAETMGLVADSSRWALAL